MKKIFLLFLIFGCVCGPLQAQQVAETATPAAPETTPPVGTAPPTLQNPAMLADPFLQGLGQNLDPRMLTGMRDELTRNLREITQMLGNVDPQDTQFVESLKREQSFVIEQLKQLDAQSKAAANPAATTPTPGAQAPQHPVPGLTGDNYGDQPPTLPENWQQMSPDELARHFSAQQPNRAAAAPQLPPLPQPPFTPPQANNEAQQMQEIVQKMRESGLNELAEQTLANWQRESQTRALPPNIPPAFPQMPTVPGGFAPPAVPGMPSATPWQPLSSQDMAELKDTISRLNLQIEQLQKDVKAMETQLQLLNQNILLNQRN